MTSPEGVELVIPPGALERVVRIRAMSVSEGFPSLPSDMSFGTVFGFLPHGLTFAQPVTLTIPHDTHVGPMLGLYAVNENGVWEVIPVGVTVTETTLQVETSSLSYFTFNWTCPPPYENERECGCYRPGARLGLCGGGDIAQPDVCCPGPVEELFCSFASSPTRFYGCCKPVPEGNNGSCPSGSQALYVGGAGGERICATTLEPPDPPGGACVDPIIY